MTTVTTKNQIVGNTRIVSETLLTYDKVEHPVIHRVTLEFERPEDLLRYLTNSDNRGDTKSEFGGAGIEYGTNYVWERWHITHTKFGIEYDMVTSVAFKTPQDMLKFILQDVPSYELLDKVSSDITRVPNHAKLHD